MSAARRQTKYNSKLAAEICLRIAEGESLKAICRDEGMPSSSLVHLWVIDDPDGFADRYARASAIQAETFADELIDLADTPVPAEKRTIKADGSEEIVIGDAIERSKLSVETRKWVMSRILPKKYGDKGDPDEKDSSITVRIVGGLPDE